MEPSTPDPPPLLWDRRGPVALLILNRPHRLNAVTPEMYRALMAGEAQARRESGVRAIVITGAGRAFCVGADLKEHSGGSVGAGASEETGPRTSGEDGPGGGGPAARQTAERKAHKRYIHLAQEANRTLQRSPLPVVAAVNGHAIGAGLELALSADLIVVSRRARLRLPEAALGTFVGGGVGWTLPRRVGLARARELLLLGEFFSPEEARTMGMVNRIAPPDQVVGEALALARTLASRSARSLRLMKELLREAAGGATLDQIMEIEADGLLACMGTPDWEEGLRAFAQGRRPSFSEPPEAEEHGREDSRRRVENRSP
jgi:enoyl-CoA hydratase